MLILTRYITGIFKSTLIKYNYDNALINNADY